MSWRVVAVVGACTGVAWVVLRRTRRTDGGQWAAATDQVEPAVSAGRRT